MRRVIIYIVCLLVTSSAFALPEEVIALVQERKNDFKRILKSSSDEQGRLILERWTDLLLRSRFTLDMQIARDELLDYLKQQFPLKEAQESKRKKGKKREELSETAEEMIAALIKAFDGSFRGAYLDLNFECDGNRYAFPFELEDVGGDLNLVMRGITVPESREARRGESRCFDLVLNRSPYPSLLEWISAVDAACPLPANRAGSCLLDVAERIARAAGRRILRLDDAAIIRCTIDRRRANLRRLRMYQSQPGWYQSRGFVLQRDLGEEEADQEKFRNYRLDRLITDFNGLKKSEEVSAVRRVLKKRAPEFQALQKDATIAQFMTWLWEKDCASYTALDAVITDLNVGSELSRLYPHFSLFEKRLE